MRTRDEGANVRFRVVGPGDETLLADLFAGLDATYFRPHPLTSTEAERIVLKSGRDVYAMLIDDEGAVAYGMLRGWDEGYAVPSLGIAVRTGMHGRGLGRAMMTHLHHEAQARGANMVRLRVHPDNRRARQLYESMGYEYRGEERAELLMVLLLKPED
jgi:ribosomal protein S18 acetylase RimI-like enzyme